MKITIRFTEPIGGVGATSDGPFGPGSLDSLVKKIQADGGLWIHNKTLDIRPGGGVSWVRTFVPYHSISSIQALDESAPSSSDAIKAV